MNRESEGTDGTGYGRGPSGDRSAHAHAWGLQLSPFSFAPEFFLFLISRATQLTSKPDDLVLRKCVLRTDWYSIYESYARVHRTVTRLLHCRLCRHVCLVSLISCAQQ